MAKHSAPTRRTLRRVVVVACAAGAVALAGTPAYAAPITCPGGQTAQQVAPGQFACVNNGGNADASGQTKNPND